MRPRKDHVVLTQIETPTVTESGIHVSTIDYSTLRGKVLAIGSAVEDLAIDEEVLFHKGSGIELGEGRILIRESELGLVW